MSEISKIVKKLDSIGNPQRVTKTSLKEAMDDIYRNIPAAGPSELREGRDVARKINDTLDEIEQDLDSTIQKCMMLVRYLQQTGVGGVAAGQMKAYTIGTLRSFIDNDNQPGSVASIRRIVGDDSAGEPSPRPRSRSSLR